MNIQIVMLLVRIFIYYLDSADQKGLKYCWKIVNRLCINIKTPGNMCDRFLISCLFNGLWIFDLYCIFIEKLLSGSEKGMGCWIFYLLHKELQKFVTRRMKLIDFLARKIQHGNCFFAHGI